MTVEPLRVCFLLSTRGFVFGGLETIADGLGSGLARRGHIITLVAGRARGGHARNDFPAGLETILVPVTPSTFSLLRTIARVLRTQPLNLQSLNFVLRALARPAVRRQVFAADVVVTFLEGEAVLLSRVLARRRPGTIYYFSGALEARWAFRDRSTLRVAISHVVADHFEGRYAYRSDAVVTPGIPASLVGAAMTAERGAEPSRLLYVGRLEANKRVEWLLQVLEALAADFPRVTLRIVGDGPLRGALEEDARGRGVADRLVFRGPLVASDVHEELRHADLLVLPSGAESFGIVALEALAAGTPVVASDLPALREATGGHASLVAPDDLGQWRHAIASLLRDAALRGARAAAGRTWARSFTWDVIAEQFELLLYEAARRHRALTHRR